MKAMSNLNFIYIKLKEFPVKTCGLVALYRSSCGYSITYLFFIKNKNVIFSLIIIPLTRISDINVEFKVQYIGYLSLTIKDVLFSRVATVTSRNIISLW